MKRVLGVALASGLALAVAGCFKHVQHHDVLGRKLGNPAAGSFASRVEPVRSIWRFGVRAFTTWLARARAKTR